MYIYKTTNTINGKCYIGKRVSNDEWDKSNYLGSGVYLKCAIKSYGKDKFKKEIIVDNINDKDKLSQLEIQMIEKNNSLYPNGYNLTKGGDGGDCVSNHINRANLKQCQPKSQETKDKISKTITGRKLSKEICQKISNANKGKKKPKRTEEHINKIRLALKGRKLAKRPNSGYKIWQTRIKNIVSNLQIQFTHRKKYTNRYKPNIEAKQLLDSYI